VSFGLKFEKPVNRARASPAALTGADASFHVLHGKPADPLEAAWRACLANSDFPTHYTAPEYFCEPMLHGKGPFAVLSIVNDRVTAIMTGLHFADRVQSGLSTRPQIAFSRGADRTVSMENLVAGLLEEARSATLIDVFLWSDIAGLVDARFRQRPYRGAVMLDLTPGPDAVFHKFSQTRRNDIRRAIRGGVCVDVAKSRDDVMAYYAVYLDWARHRGVPITGEAEFEEEFFTAKSNRQLFLARYNGKVVAGVVLRFFPGGVVEHAARSFLQTALHLKPNDLLHWRAIEWACAQGLTKYNLGGTGLFLRKFGGEVVQTTRHRLDLSMFRRYTVGDWIEGRIETVRSFIPQRVDGLARALRSRVRRLRA
jgi:hypothetical protein